MVKLTREVVTCNEGMTMTNGTDPSGMTGQERLAEVSMLLSLAMMRMWLKHRRRVQSASLDERGFSTFSTKTSSISLAPSRNDGPLLKQAGGWRLETVGWQA
jgi:hypothetical protein